MNRKAVSPVVATMLLVAVAVSSVSAYWVWVRSFQTQIQKEVEQQAGVSGNLRLDIVSLTDDGTSYYVTLKNSSSSGIITFNGPQDFIIDGQNNWESIQPTLPRSVNAGSNVTFVLKRSTNHSTGTTHSFVFIGHTPRDQVVATISYRDS
ncbi:MAG: hypothetical protein AMQ22_01169 [Candidatus Methanofastidiosum methylothiophilum]|uniref:Archaebacterial flagellin n=1 Tax=Candidatus Methanofastidiosum methylothiophilum TaxID=1705564 RepID=A0A150J3T4_9EURY|nr:MAG: hypothetical protein AMQ22_01169 [Candidatus Methanofastidiosum methylthiophilus]